MKRPCGIETIGPRARRVAGILATSVALFLGGCGGESDESVDPMRANAERLAEIRYEVAKRLPIEGVQEREVGEDDEGAVLFWDSQRRKPPPRVVVLLHGWGPPLTAPAAYGSWISHLATRGQTVIFPTYYPLDGDPAKASRTAMAGIAAGLAALGATPKLIVAAGHTTGGALAFDYAAGARARGLPRPDAVYAIFPARNPSGFIPPIDPAGISPRTQLTVVSGDGNPVVDGEKQARSILWAAKRVPLQRRKLLEADPGAHPLRADSAARRAFWRPLDRLITTVWRARARR